MHGFDGTFFTRSSSAVLPATKVAPGILEEESCWGDVGLRQGVAASIILPGHLSNVFVLMGPH